MKLADRQLVLDTNVLVHLIRRGTAGRLLDDAYGLTARRPRPIISVVSRGEIKALALDLGWGEEKLRSLEALLAHLPAADISASQVVDAYAQLDHESRKRGRKMGKNDLWIAATAHVAQAVLLTTDRDFDHLNPALIQVEYVEPEKLKGGTIS